VKKLIIALVLAVVMVVVFASPVLAQAPEAVPPPEAGLGIDTADTNTGKAPDSVPGIETIKVPLVFK